MCDILEQLASDPARARVNTWEKRDGRWHEIIRLGESGRYSTPLDAAAAARITFLPPSE